LIPAAARKAKIFYVGLLSLCAVITCHPCFAQQTSVYHVGLVAHDSKEEVLKSWQPTVDYLSQHIPGATFEIVPVEARQFHDRTIFNNMDFIIANPPISVELTYFHNVRRIASITREFEGREFDYYGGVIIARADRDDIQSLADLRGKRFVAVNAYSFGGWLSSLAEFQKSGLNPYRDFSQQAYLGSHRAVLFEVLEGKADAGIVETGVLEELNNEGQISLGDLKVLNPKTFYKRENGTKEKLPFLCSTELFPEWSIVAMPGVSDEIAKKVTMELFAMGKNDPAVKAGGYAQWVVPHNYSKVSQYFQKMESFVFDMDSSFFWESLGEIFKKHWVIVLTMFAVALYLIFLLMTRFLLAKHLKDSQKILSQELEEHWRAEEALRQSQQMLQLVLDTLPSRVFWKDTSSSFLGCNKSFAKDCGYNEAYEIIGKNDYDMPWSEEESDHFRADDKKVMDSKEKVLNINEPQTRADGELRWVRTNKAPLLDNSGKVIGILGTYEDITEQKKALEALKASEAKYRELVEYANSIIIRILPNGTISFFNEFAQSFFGYTQEESVGRSIFTILPANGIDQNEFKEIIEDIRTHPDAYAWHENENIKKDGTRVWISWSNRGIFSKDGELIEILCVGTDMTERRVMETELRKLSHALEQSQNVVIITDTNGNIEFVNPKFAEVTGYAQQEVIGKNTRFLKSGEQTEETYSQLWATIKEGGTWRGEFHNRKKNGELFWQRTTISAIRDKYGKIIHFLAINEDITKEKELAQELQKAFDRLKEMERIINLSNAILFLWRDTANWKVDFVSDNISHWGYAPEEFYKREKTFKTLVHPEDLDFLEEEARRAINKKKSEFFVQHRIRTQSEEFRWVEDYTWITYDKAGRVKRFQTVAFDITERKMAEDRMLEAINIKSEFISIVSHELRTPLTAIKEGINIVAEQEAGELNQKQKEFLGIAKRNVDRLGALINDVLDYQKLDSGRTQFHWSVGSMKPAIEEVARTMGVVAKNRGLELRTTVAENLYDVNYDYDRIIQVLNNLVNNAIKFTKEGYVEIVAENDNEGIRVSVRDTGIGIRNEDLHRLFQTFSQVYSGSNRRTGESGLGLAISKRIIDLHGGRIWVNSIFGEGSVFSFVLPRMK